MTVNSQMQRGALLATILLVLVPLRFSFLAVLGPYGADASCRAALYSLLARRQHAN